MPKKKKHKPSKLKQRLLTVAIAIIFALFIGVGINTFYDEPNYEDYCERSPHTIYTQAECEAEGGKWTQYGPEAPKPVESNVTMTGWCDQYYTCEKEYDQVSEVYNRNVFIISIIAAGVAFILGGIVLSLESVSAGFMLGGILIAIYGTLRYWGAMSKYLRFIILGIVLALLIWIGYKKLKK